MPYLFILILLASCLQSLSQIDTSTYYFVLGSTGNYSSSSSFSVSATTGEPAGTTLRGASNILTQGFQQPSGERLKEFQVLYNAFSPNGDGINDSWIIYGIAEYPDNEVAIFNRWGDLVWNAEGYDNSSIVWEGTDKHNYKLPAGTYFYVLKIPYLDTFTGWVQITL